MTTTRRGFLKKAAFGAGIAIVPTMTPRGAGDPHNRYDEELERRFPGAWRRVTLREGDAPFSMRSWIGEGWMLLRSEPPYDGEWIKLVNAGDSNAASPLVKGVVDLWFVKSSHVLANRHDTFAPAPASTAASRLAEWYDLAIPKQKK